MATATNAQILLLSQWLSPAYPVGAFAYSHGLEAAVDQGWVRNGSDLQDWLDDLLEHGAGRSDALFLAAAWRAKTRKTLIDTDTTARAFAASKERLFETCQQGGSFSRVTQAVWGTELTNPPGQPGLTYPVALGAAAAAQALPLDLTLSMYLQAFVSNLIAAGQRLLPVGQTEGQEILHRLTQRLPEIAEHSADGDLTRLSATAFLGDIAAMKHETQRSRIFRT
ncbi:urease accessory protein UreF [Pseudophaeobacter flagellatus]|uniref:urease accessory protein UreF n=1 Tax=Pseudophaeobacter flagellatus TaxID=2899119 RepID=UPI001E37F01F|nr:urease accessory UreF family protein [Pseudophaeobacter flagellatus]MCD9146271.1 urease accessory protein UreF [Pseudophaeobacter flagellatus]